MTQSSTSPFREKLTEFEISIEEMRQNLVVWRSLLGLKTPSRAPYWRSDTSNHWNLICGIEENQRSAASYERRVTGSFAIRPQLRVADAIASEQVAILETALERVDTLLDQGEHTVAVRELGALEEKIFLPLVDVFALTNSIISQRATSAHASEIHFIDLLGAECFSIYAARLSEATKKAGGPASICPTAIVDTNWANRQLLDESVAPSEFDLYVYPVSARTVARPWNLILALGPFHREVFNRLRVSEEIRELLRLSFSELLFSPHSASIFLNSTELLVGDISATVVAGPAYVSALFDEIATIQERVTEPSTTLPLPSSVRCAVALHVLRRLDLKSDAEFMETRSRMVSDLRQRFDSYPVTSPVVSELLRMVPYVVDIMLDSRVSAFGGRSLIQIAPAFSTATRLSASAFAEALFPISMEHLPETMLAAVESRPTHRVRRVEEPSYPTCLEQAIAARVAFDRCRGLGLASAIPVDDWRAAILMLPTDRER